LSVLNRPRYTELTLFKVGMQKINTELGLALVKEVQIVETYV